MSADLNSTIAGCTTVSLSDSATQYNKPGLPLIVVDNAHCRAVIAPQGAHLVEFERKSVDDSGATPLLWLSPAAKFTSGKAIRGGIPVCFPWFGPHSQDPGLPQHGLARNRNWLFTETCETTDATELTFVLTSSKQTLQLYPHNFRAELHLNLGKTLTVTLTVHNLDEQIMPVNWALHSYFPVSDPAKVTVPELVGHSYVDKANNNCEKHLVENLDFNRFVDAVFTRSPDAVTLVRPEGNISITTDNAPTTVAWNPNTGANAIADLGPGTFTQFVCVERGAALDDRWQLPAGESISARMSIVDYPRNRAGTH